MLFVFIILKTNYLSTINAKLFYLCLGFVYRTNNDNIINWHKILTAKFHCLCYLIALFGKQS